MNPDTPAVKTNLESNKARVLRHRDMQGRPIIYIPAKNHSASDRDIDDLTKFIVYCLVNINCLYLLKFLLNVNSLYRKKPAKNALKRLWIIYALFLIYKVSD